MADFIEVHQLGKPRLVNLDWVEEIWPTENGTQIYFAFTSPDAVSQDFITTDESYDKIKRIIAYQWDEKIVPIVEKWSKENPRKTRQDAFLEQWSEVEIDKKGILLVCPKLISTDYREKYGSCTNRFCSDCRREFWMQEVE